MSPGRPRVDRALVERLARLARLELDEPRADRLAEDLSRMLELVDAVGEVDVTGVPPYVHVEAATPARPDRAEAPGEPEALLDLAPRVDHRRIVVPRVIE